MMCSCFFPIFEEVERNVTSNITHIINERLNEHTAQMTEILIATLHKHLIIAAPAKDGSAA